MSKKESSPNDGEQAPDLSALDFGPAWARNDQPKKKGKPSQGKSSSSPRGGGKSPRKGGRDSRRKDTGGDRGQGRDYRRQQKGGKPRRPMVEAPDGVKARIMPIEEGMDAMAKQISATGRTHSVFELAWVVLGALDRFHIIFESEEPNLYRSKSDHSVWIYQKECMSQFWVSGMVKKYYDEEVTEVEPPSGNFQSVARCGFSGTLIGPPNHHGYQQALLDLHREKFSNMALDRYKAKIVMEHSEEVVQEWIDSMRKHTRWRPKQEPVKEVIKSDSDEPDQDSPEQDASDQAVTNAVESSAVQESAETPIIEETVVILDNRREVEQHFLIHGFEDEFEKGNITSVLANVPSNMISPGLMTLLKNTVSEEKRYPGNLASILCRQMSGRHLAVFKWKKRLHCGPARPKHVPDDMVMADRPASLFQWVLAHPNGNIDTMWKDCLPEGITEDERHTWYHDLHWLINEGLVLLFADGTLHAAKELEKSAAKQQGGKDKTETAPPKQAEGDTAKDGSSSEPAAEDN